jgi:hypothetical protein
LLLTLRKHLYSINKPNKQEECECRYEERNERLKKKSVLNFHGAAKGNGEISEINIPEQESDRWGYDIRHKRIHNGIKSRAYNDTNGQVDHAAPRNKGLELRIESGHASSIAKRAVPRREAGTLVEIMVNLEGKFKQYAAAQLFASRRVPILSQRARDRPQARNDERSTFVKETPAEEKTLSPPEDSYIEVERKSRESLVIVIVQIVRKAIGSQKFSMHSEQISRVRNDTRFYILELI